VVNHTIPIGKLSKHLSTTDKVIKIKTSINQIDQYRDFGNEVETFRIIQK
jgi:hypothetical protein